MKATRVEYWSAVLCLGSLWLVAPRTTARAADLNEQQVRTAVRTWVRYVTTDARPDAEIETMEACTIDGRTTAYVAHLLGGGFCLCGANDLVLPVYLYSPTGHYEKDHPGYECILREIAMRTRTLSDAAEAKLTQPGASQELLEQRAVLWRQLLSGSPRPSNRGPVKLFGEPDRIELPLTSKWRQDSPYNDQCPVLTPGTDEHCLVGCMATAAAQLMYYWKWPLTGVGQTTVDYNWRFRTTWDEEPLSAGPSIPAGSPWAGRLEWTSANGGRLRMNGYWDRGVHDNAVDLAPGNAAYQQALETLYARLTPGVTKNAVNFGATTYNWSLMQDAHSDPVDGGDVEVAKFCYQTAIAYRSEFLYGRGTLSEFYPEPFSDFFRYDPDVMHEFFTNMTAMATAITEEITWLRPVGESVTLNLSQGGGGHGLVICGYDKRNDPQRQFLVNYGWGAGSRDWLSLDQISMPYPGYHGLVRRLAPINVVKFVGAATLGDGSPANPYLNIESALSSAPNGATLIFKAGSDNTFAAATLTLSRPMTLKGVDVTIRKQ